MPSKFILRFDDVAPGMAWSKFLHFEALLLETGVKPILGVVPRCLDPKLEIEPPVQDFWDKVRDWSKNGWVIAQHGYTHQYVNTNPGIFSVGNKSEFAGLSYVEQYEKIKAGKDILVAQGVWQPVFMAPGHSLDRTTLKALHNLGFELVTDGYGIYPYRIERVLAVPQLFSSSVHFGFGVYTLCLHVNNMTHVECEKVERFVRANAGRFISIFDASMVTEPISGLGFCMRHLTRHVLRIGRLVKRFLY